MRIGIIQSNYIPWRGYFDFIASVDLFVFHDDLQYTKGDWRNRNKIKTPKGLEWLSAPVQYDKVSQLILDTKFDESSRWRKQHLNKFSAAYAKAPYKDDALGLLQEALEADTPTVSRLNIHLIKTICAYLGIGTELAMSSDLGVSGAKTERVINILQAVGGTTYLSGQNADVYLEKDRFVDAGIGLEYKSYDYEPYPQLWGEFEGAVTILDLIANCGTQSKNFIRSKTPDKVII